MSRTRRSPIAASLFLAAAIGVGGYTASSGTSSATSPPPAAAGPGGSSAPAVPRVGQHVAGPALAARIEAAMRGAGSGTTTITAGGSTSTGAFRFAGDRIDQRMTIPVEDTTMQIVAVDGLIYVSGMPDQATLWIRIEPSSSDAMSTFFADALRNGFTDPRVMATAFQDATATVRAVAPGRVTYELNLDPAVVVGGSSLGLASSTSTSTRFSYVLDAQDRPVTVTTTVQDRPVLVAYAGWGADPAIQAPPADQVGVFERPAVD